MNAVTCPSTTTCYTVGNGGTILKTSNAGQSWISQTSGVSSNLSSVSCYSESGCVAVGTAAATTLAAASAAGATNIKVSSITGLAAGQTIAIDTGANQELGTIATVGTMGAAGTGVTLNAPLVDAHASGAAVAGLSAALRTTDGSAWSAATGQVFGSLNAVSCASPTSCTAVGTSGAIDVSGDGGATWSAQASGSTATLSAVACPGPTTCFVTGSATSGTALMLRTTDGQTWSPQTIGGGQSLAALACLDTSNCFAAGAFGTVLTTTDSGATWTQQGNPLSGPVGALNASNLAINGAACNPGHCVLAAGAQADIMLTPTLTVTVDTSSPFGTAPALTGIAANASSLSFSPSEETGNVTGTLSCSTTATAATGVGSYPVSACNGLSDPGFSVVYSYASSSVQIGKASQTITFADPGAKTFGAPDFTVAPTASSGLAVTVTVGASDPCTVSGLTIHLTGSGSCSITAGQAGNANFDAAASVTRTIEIGNADVTRTVAAGKADQTISFPAVPNHNFGDADFSILASSSSGLAVSLAAAAGSACTLAGATVHMTGAGSCSITASQGGDAGHNAATSVTRSFVIGKGSQTIRFVGIGNTAFGAPDFQISATASSTLEVAFRASGKCTVKPLSSGYGLVHLTAAGKCTITASQGGDANRLAATPVARTFTIAAFSLGNASGSALQTGNGGTASFAVTGGKKLAGTLSWHRKKVQFDAKKVTGFALAAGGKSAWIYGVGSDGRKFTLFVTDNGTQKGAGDSDMFRLWIAGRLAAGGKLVKGNVKVTR
jgi:photosystem II stability/assembly factor-like uncharacterized protein